MFIKTLSKLSIGIHILFTLSFFSKIQYNLLILKFTFLLTKKLLKLNCIQIKLLTLSKI